MASWAVKPKLASMTVVRASGPFRISVVGAVRSPATVQTHDAGEASTLPKASTARTWSACGPSLRPVNAEGIGHGVKVLTSRAHSKVAAASSLSKAKTALALTVWLSGPKTIAVSGGSSSTTDQVTVVIGASGDSSGTSTRTSKVCEPNGSPPYAFGEVHGENSPALRAHSKVSSRPLALNSKVALRLSVRAAGRASISTAGARIWTSHVYTAGVGSTLPAASRARTAKSCEP